MTDPRPILFVLAFAAQTQARTESAPVNDLFIDSAPLEGERIALTAPSHGATVELGEPLLASHGAGATLWWRWEPPRDLRVTIATTGSDFDTVLGIYTGPNLETLQTIATNDDENLEAGFFTSRILFRALAGSIYHIAVGGFDPGNGIPETGTVALSIEPAPPAPEWQALDLDGNTVRSTDFMGNVVLIDFWATWCVPCLAEIPGFRRLQERLGPRGLQIVGIATDEGGASIVSAFAERENLNYTVVLTTPEIESAFGGLGSIPTGFLVDRNNILVSREIGFRDEAFWENALGPLLDEPAANPVPGPTLTIHRDADGLRIRWQAPAAETFQLESTASPGQDPWTISEAAIAGENGLWNVRIARPIENRFFRLRER